MSLYRADGSKGPRGRGAHLNSSALPARSTCCQYASFHSLSGVPARPRRAPRPGAAALPGACRHGRRRRRHGRAGLRGAARARGLGRLRAPGGRRGLLARPVGPARELRRVGHVAAGGEARARVRRQGARVTWRSSATCTCSTGAQAGPFASLVWGVDLWALVLGPDCSRRNPTCRPPHRAPPSPAGRSAFLCPANQQQSQNPRRVTYLPDEGVRSILAAWPSA